MKKLIPLLLLFVLTSSVNAISKDSYNTIHQAPKRVEYVYICNSSKAYAYHSTESCRGLERCTHGVSRVTLQEAINEGRVPCKICER